MAQLGIKREELGLKKCTFSAPTFAQPFKMSQVCVSTAQLGRKHPPSPPQLTIDNPTSLPIFRRDFEALLGKDDDDVRSYKNSTMFGYSLKIVLVLVVGAGLTS